MEYQFEQSKDQNPTQNWSLNEQREKTNGCTPFFQRQQVLILLYDLVCTVVIVVNKKKNNKHSENANTSMSVTFDLEL